MTQLMQDIRYGFRRLRQSPAFAVVSIAALALGIGANATMFSVVNSVLMQPVPFAQPERLGFVFETSAAQGWNQIGPSGPDYADIREQAKALADVAMIEPGSGTVLGFGEPRQMPGLRVTNNFFRLLGKKPFQGRDFEPGEGFQNRVGMLSFAGWHKLFGSHDYRMGRSIVLDGIPYTGIGIMPPDMWFPLPADLFAPWNTEDLRRQDRMSHRFVMIARLKPGITFRQASAELNTIVNRIGQNEPRMKGWGAVVIPMQELLVHNVEPALLVLQGAVGLVLLIACTNLANLMLARGASRQRETAVRTALGATRGALVRQFFTEAMILGLLGGIVGTLLTAWGVALLNHVLPSTIAAGEGNTQIVRPEIVVDGTVLLFMLGLSLLTAMLFGLAPAISASRADVNEVLKEGGRNSGSAHSRRTRGALVVAEVALALVLLVCAGLTLKSFWRLRQTSPGFLADHALTMQMELPTDSKYRKPGEQAAFFRQVLTNVSQIPGVRTAGITCGLPLDEDDHQTDFRIVGRPLPPSGQLLPADYRAISDGYFAAMGIPLLRGRGIAAQDYYGRPNVAVIDATLARRYWPSSVAGPRDPVGQKIAIGEHTFEIVGIVGEVMNGGVDRKPRPTIYLSYLQQEEPRMTLVVRHPWPAQIIGAVKQAVYAVDKDQPVYNIRTLDQVVTASTASLRLTFVLLGVFAAAALALAAIGIYGVISYTVAPRTSEIGIRMALGADRRSVIRLIVGQGMILTTIGIAAGAAGALVASRLLASLLYGVNAHDPLIFLATALVLALVGACATWVPAQRATRIDPIASLRYQ
ncbi:MAG TPA: ABC transporter permease [Bryobacteraceae bacterium]|nr:ABC transporter permease [Bryobacteraceae bacterium]